jgi:N-formylmaleamate deformylase
MQTMVNVKDYRDIKEFIPAHWQSKTIIANGIEQHYYRTGGNKPTLILLHGVTAGSLNFLRVAKMLENDFDLILLDARGHGRSARVGNQFSFPLLVEDVAQFIKKLGLTKPHLLGHSMGGVTAALLAAKYPHLLGSVTLEESLWAEDNQRQQIGQNEHYQAWLKTYIAYLEKLKTLPHEARMTAALPFVPPGAAEKWREEDYITLVECQAQLDMGLFGLGAALWSMTRIDTPLSELVKQIICPFMLMLGNPAKGGGNDPEIVQTVMANWHNGQCYYFEDSGHLLHQDEPEEFVALVKTFLTN